MLAKNMRMVQDMAGHLIVVADSQSGKTVKDLSDLFGISDTAVRNILHKYKGFRKTIPDKWPTEYWFDISISDGLIPSKDPRTSSGQPVAGKYRTYVGEFERWTGTSAFDRSEVENQIDTILQGEEALKKSIQAGFLALSLARRMAREFPVRGTLDKKEWEEALSNLAKLRYNISLIGDYIEFLMTDDRINTPEYWMVFKNTIKQ